MGFKIHKVIFALLVVPFALWAQPRYEAKITGYVFDAETGDPLPSVNVYLKATQLGDATDKKGYYTIERIPPGKYTLIISMMGYKEQKIDIQLSERERREISVYLRPQIMPGEEVTVTAKYPKEWHQNLKTFAKAFFGMTDFANQCKILNAEVLDFEYDKDSHQFRAFAKQPLIFLNEALGYRVVFNMKKFEAWISEGETYRFSNTPGVRTIFELGPLECEGKTQFCELVAKNEAEENLWKKNRQLTYQGSLRHFLTALLKKNLKKNGFRLRGSTKFASRYDYKIAPDTLLRSREQASQYVLKFSNYLHITYKEKFDDISYRIGLQMYTLFQPHDRIDKEDDEELERTERLLKKISMYQDSWLKISEHEGAKIQVKGEEVKSYTGLSIAGYWGYCGAANWLPTEFIYWHREGFKRSLSRG